MNVNAPVAGILLVWGRVSRVWDSDSTALSTAILSDEVLVDGSQVSLATLDAKSSDMFELSSRSGARPVAAGAHTVTLRGRERGTGMAVIQPTSS